MILYFFVNDKDIYALRDYQVLIVCEFIPPDELVRIKTELITH